VTTPARLRTRLTSMLPHGGSLPVEDWHRRHRGIVVLLWLNVLSLPVFGVVIGGWGITRSITDAASIVVFAGLATWTDASRKLRTISASLGLMVAAALFVDASGGRIESHFYFFVLVIVMTLYEDWAPFLIAVGFVLIHHGVMGTIDPSAVFYSAYERRDPWLWAGIHAAFVAAAGIAGLVAWRLNEDVRTTMREAYQRVEELSETDSLTGLWNRRRLMTNLAQAVSSKAPTAVVLLDLDGFKEYNDKFGHPAGDALLVRLSHRLAAAANGRGGAYRLGGDEFCVVWSVGADTPAALERIAHEAMSESGEGFRVSASYGTAELPADGISAEHVLRTADHRMYAHKHSLRPSSRVQTSDVLARTLAERHPDLSRHGQAVTALAERVARWLGLTDEHVDHVRIAAQLHDIGKIGIPDAVINKPAALDDHEWAFIRQHTVIGERILRAAPALAPVARLVRSTHERFDGAGYPDGLAGEQIPIGARIVFVCDAFDAMTSERGYSVAKSRVQALEEIQRCAGTQFDPRVVQAFVAELDATSLGHARRTHSRAHGSAHAAARSARHGPTVTEAA
jgi:diguanylate cyclase (GGDEF)-like protein/putative nucleotidyltransferase with HDIG domain